MRSPFVTLRNGILAPMHEYGFKLYMGIFISYGWTLFGLNLLTILLCAPIITAPAAICALNRVLMKLTLERECSIMKEYWAEFKSSFFKVLPFFSIGTAISVALGIVIYLMFASDSLLLGGYVILALCIIACIFIYLVFTYAIALFVSVDLPVSTNIKNAVLLTLSQPKRDIYILLMPLAITVICVLFFPYTLAVFLILIPAFTSLISCCIIKPVFEEKILLSD